MINSVDTLWLSVAVNQDCANLLRPYSRLQEQMLTQEISRQRSGVDIYPIQMGKASSDLYQRTAPPHPFNTNIDRRN